MALSALRVKDFQSVDEVAISFGLRESGGGITTIVGPSSTGKSALLRALRLLVRNSASVPVRAGAKTTSVEAQFSDAVVAIERGPGLSTYTVGAEVYAKAGVGVPEDVVKAMQLSTGTPDVHFSFQFDKPYLVGESGSTVSEVIGRLTNANVLREAVREGTVRARRAKQVHESRMVDAKALAVELKDKYATLPQRETALVAAREAVSEADRAFARAERLAVLSKALEAARAGLEAVEASRAKHTDVTPLLDQAQALLSKVEGLESAVAQITLANEGVDKNLMMAAGMNLQANQFDEEYHAVLVEAGVCPTCEQAVA